MDLVLIILLLTLTIWRVLDIVEANIKDYYKQKLNKDQVNVINYKYKDEA